MSRLDSFIRRLQAQRSCLNFARDQLLTVDGPIFELGLGNGRTYDHLRDIFPDRDIYVFDYKISAHPDCIPPDSHMILGDIHETLPAAAERFRHAVALVHSDIGSGDRDANKRIAEFIQTQLPDLLRPSGLVLSDQQIELEDSDIVTPPDDVPAGRYYICRYLGG